VQLKEQQARCRDVQLLKFGQEIDVWALLDTIGVRNHEADNLRRALKQQVLGDWFGVGFKLGFGNERHIYFCSSFGCCACHTGLRSSITSSKSQPPLHLHQLQPKQERTHLQQLTELESHIRAKTRELLLFTLDNTNALNTISAMTRSQRGLEAQVLAHKPGLFEDQLQTRRAAVAERHALVSRVNSKAATLQQMSARIDALRRKNSVLYS